MLVLTRRVGEKVVIGNEVVVEVLSVSGEGVRLGIRAPRETSVHRYEVFEQIQAANLAASAPKAAAEELAARLRARDAASRGEAGGAEPEAETKDPE
jgi:carbon storage regulator